SGQVRFLWVRGRGTRAVRTKTQLAQYKTKKWGYTAKRKKVGWCVFLVHRFGDGRLITHVSIGYISIHTAIGMDVYSDICMGNYVDSYICGYIPIRIDRYVFIHISV